MQYKSLLFLLLFGLIIQANVQAKTGLDVKDDLIAAVNKAVNVYNDNGMSGLIAETERCYRDVNQNPFFCIHLDLASRHIDRLMVAGAAQQGMTFPKTGFFEDQLFGQRIVPVFRHANMDMEASNAYLRLVTPVVNRLVNDNIFSARPLSTSNENGRDGVYVAYDNGIVRDTNTGLEWFAGPDKDMNFKQAKSWVSSLIVNGGRWRMPTKDELKGLYKKGTGVRNMTSLLKTTGWWIWAGHTESWFSGGGFYFADGPRPWITRLFSSNRRAFAVRSRSITAKTPLSVQYTKNRESKAIETKQPATSASIDKPVHYPGDTYIVESVFLDSPKWNNVTERRVISVEPDKLITTSQNLSSKTKTIRTIEYTSGWNLISTRNPNGSGVDFSPPLKYYEFPLYPGETWKQVTVATNVKTGAIREFSLSGLVGDWEDVSVPAGKFKGIKVTVKRELLNRTTGKRSSGTDNSWYVPELRRSVKSETTSRNSEGVEGRQLIQLKKYELKGQHYFGFKSEHSAPF